MCSYDPNNTSELWILTNLASALIMLVNEGCVETRSCFSALIRIIMAIGQQTKICVAFVVKINEEEYFMTMCLY